LLRYFFVFICFLPFLSKGIHDPTNVGAASLGMGTIGVVGVQYQALYHNQAILAYIHAPKAGLDYNQGIIADQNLSTKSAGLVLPTNWGTLGLNFRYFGFSLYNEQKIGLAFGKKLGEKLAVGVQLDYFRTYIGNDYGSAQAVSFEIGLYSKINDDLEIGAHIFNPVGTEIGKDLPELIPIVFSLGLLYHIDDDLLIATEVKKGLKEKPNFKFGIEYSIGEYFVSRVGLSTAPSLFTFGFGINYKRFVFDIGTAYHQTLGFTPAVSLLFNF
jgi:hypothetical protein